MEDSGYMKRVLHLARKGIAVSPNPKVGALLVRDGLVIGRGFHSKFGGPHAEVEAIQNAGRTDLRGSTLFVNLEPCCHQGKTPPCTDLIIRCGIKRVVIGMQDPNPLVSGRGIQQLKAAGIEVQTDVLSGACLRLNESFVTRMKLGRPLITLKIAQTLDGKIFDPLCTSRRITEIPARTSVHKIRREHDALLVGVNTVIQDDPKLTVRHVSGRTPTRIILDGHGRIPLNAQIWKEPGQIVVVVSDSATKDKIQILEHQGAMVWRLPGSDRFSIQDLLQALKENGINSILVEGGSDVFTYFLGSGSVDRLFVFWAPKIYGEGVPALDDPGRSIHPLRFEITRWSRRGVDLLMEARRCSQV